MVQPPSYESLCFAESILELLLEQNFSDFDKERIKEMISILIIEKRSKTRELLHVSEG